MLFQRFFEAISSLLPDRAIGDLDALAHLNPDKFYLENVRSILGVSSDAAQRICDTAVRQGVFRKLVEVVCPNGAAAASSEREDGLPEVVRCWKEENGNYEEVEIPTRELVKRIFYRLNNEAAASEHHTQPA